MKTIIFIKLIVLLVSLSLLTSCVQTSDSGCITYSPTSGNVTYETKENPKSKYKYEVIIYSDNYNINIICYSDSIYILPNGGLYYEIGAYDGFKTHNEEIRRNKNGTIYKL